MTELQEYKELVVKEVEKGNFDAAITLANNVKELEELDAKEVRASTDRQSSESSSKVR